jgi:hypothetical protein
VGNASRNQRNDSSGCRLRGAKMNYVKILHGFSVLIASTMPNQMPFIIRIESVDPIGIDLVMVDLALTKCALKFA